VFHINARPVQHSRGIARPSSMTHRLLHAHGCFHRRME
jgi:hypothetical protein